MSLSAILALGAGGLVGVGLYLVVRQLMPGMPALGPALRGLNAPTVRPAGLDPAEGPLGALATRLRPPYRELALIGYSVERYVTEKILFSLVGLLMPVLLGLILIFTPVHIGIVIPAVFGLALAALFWWLVDVSIRQRADDARKVFSRRVAVYLNLVAQQLAKSKGPTEALETAASVGGGWVFDRIRGSLAASRVRLEPPWDGLRAVAVEIGVPDLGEIGDIMTVAGAEGGQVYQTLRARANSMHAAWIATEEEQANKATTVLYMPTSLLVFVLFIVGAYPMLIRLFTS
jgi:tight adherence protein C